MKELRCLICGMKINARNFNINENSFIEKNSAEHIASCPFCGVSELYLSEEDNIYSIDNLSLYTQKLLDSAMKLEIFNGEFYLEASKMAKSDKVKKMFKDLSGIEFFHARVHQRLGEFSELPKLHKPDYSKHDTDEKLLLEASKREKHAVSFYQRYITDDCTDTLREILNALSEVEKQHICIVK